MQPLYELINNGLMSYVPGQSELNMLLGLVAIIMLAVGWKLSGYVYHFIVYAVRLAIAVCIAGLVVFLFVKWGPIWFGLADALEATV